MAAGWGSRAVALSLPALFALASGTGCADSGDEGDLPGFQTEDVGGAVDRAIRPEDDIQEAARVAPALVGVLPSDFPSDVWVYEPSLIVDFSHGEERPRYVVFLVREPYDRVVARLGRRLAADGWSGPAVGGENPVEFSKGDRAIGVAVDDQRTQCHVRIEY